MWEAGLGLIEKAVTEGLAFLGGVEGLELGELGMVVIVVVYLAPVCASLRTDTDYFSYRMYIRLVSIISGGGRIGKKRHALLYTLKYRGVKLIP